MLIIHGIWAQDVLSLWAEDAAREPVIAAPRQHPFAADSSHLAELLAELAEPVPDLARKAVESELTLWLPSRRSGPQSSPDLVRSARQETGRLALARWSVPALAFDAVAALSLLGILTELDAGGTGAGAGGAGAGAGGAGAGGAGAGGTGAGGTGAGGTGATWAGGTGAVDAVVGGSVVYLAAVARFAADLAERARVLPGLTHAAAGYAARWRPVLSGTDAQRARELTDAMPPLCRAVSADGEEPSNVLNAALDAFADAAVRARLEDQRGGWALLPARRGRRPVRVPVAERWADALLGADARIPVSVAQDEQEAVSLATALSAWRACAQAPAGPVRTCFRLVEPPDGTTRDDQHAASADDMPDGTADQPDGRADGATDQPDDRASWTSDRRRGTEPAEDGSTWRVEFSLQSTEDPSLMLTADDIWAGTSGWAVGGIRHADEELLAGLGTAARLFPELDAELRRAAPASAILDTGGAFRFLRETGPLLAGAGFGVLLPDWARRTRLGLKLTTRPRAASESSVTGAAFSMNDLVDFRYDIAVGDEALDADELAELARLKIPLVRIRGQWVELDERNLRAALRFMERGRQGTVTAGEALLAGLRDPEDELPVVSVDAGGWLGDLLSGEADRRLAPVATPASFHGALRPYQERGLAWLAFLSSLRLGGILADDMGLGKTAQTLALLAHERDAGLQTGPTLLVCPMSLAGNWQREAARFAPDLTVHLHHGADRLTGEALGLALASADLVITTYAIAARDQSELAQVSWQRVVCDEAQNIKNSATRQARAVRALPAGSRIALTGTPVENRLFDLWSIMEFASPGLLGPATRFRTEYAIPVERSGDDAAAARLRRLTGPFILRRLKTDTSIISDLPAKQEMKTWCNLTPEQASLYQATVADMLARIEAAEEGIERRGLVLATMAKLKQVCNHPAHLLRDGSRLPGRSGKLARLEEICDEVIAEGDKALCFTQYAEFGRMLQPHLAARLGCPVLLLDGKTPKAGRDSLVSAFQEINEPAVFLLSLKAGGTGLNLTAANHVIHVDRWWNPAVEAQATDRAFRIGQRKDVQVRTFICVGTLEERIDAMIEKKKALAERIVGTGEGWLTELSVADLRAVVELSSDAVSE